MPTIYELAQEFRADLADIDDQAAAQLVARYGLAFEQVMRDIEALVQQIAERRRQGLSVPISWLYRQGRLEAILNGVGGRIAEYADFADMTVLNGQRQAVELALTHNQGMIGEGLRRSTDRASLTAVFNRPPIGALDAIAGHLADGSPLRSLFASFGPVAADSAEVTLVNAVAQGIGPRQTAKALADDLSVPLQRALTISRTEQNRASRSASQAVYDANADVLEGWLWTTTLDLKTCPVCIAMAGTFHPLSEIFASHPNCRCCPRPKVIGVADAAGNGDKWFAALAPGIQKDLLGPAKFEAYRDGRLTLAQLVVDTDHPRWGPGRREATLAEIGIGAAKKAA